jgi:hypothetical protein
MGAAPGIKRQRTSFALNISAAASSAPTPAASPDPSAAPAEGTPPGSAGEGVASGMPRVRGLPFTSTHASGMHSTLMTAGHTGVKFGKGKQETPQS